MTRLRKMALSSSKNIDHGNYIPLPIVPGMKVADGEHIRKVFILSSGSVGSSFGEAGGSGDGGRGAYPGTAGVAGPSDVTAEVGIPENIEVGTDASLNLTVVVLPGVSARIPLTIDLTGAHSEIRLSGIYLCSGHDEVTFDITMHHRNGDCHSQQIFNGLASGEAKCGFFGRIVIAPDAQRTEAFQENHSILLSDSARINTKPRLEIFADDVKCSHGATVGRLNEDEQFYMRSRGIPEDEAKVLQMISFVAPVLDSIPEEAFDGSPSRSAVAEQVENAIRRL